VRNGIESRRQFLKTTGLAAGALLLPTSDVVGQTEQPPSSSAGNSGLADYTIRIATTPIELAPGHIISATTYNGQFPGPLLRFKEGQPVTVDIFNETDVAEQLHWHGQIVGTDVDGAAEEGTPYIPANGGMRRLEFTPRPAGLRFYHTHNRAGADLYAGQYSGQVGPVYIEAKSELGRYDREVCLTLKEFEPTFSRGGDMAQDFLSPANKVKELEQQGESAMTASLARGMPHGYEVGYGSFTINGRMLHHGEPIRVKQGERVMFHVLNGSATEIRSLALPGHTFEVIAMDGNPVPTPARVPVLWLGTAERISAIVQMNHPGTWIMGDLDNHDRRHGMGIVVEYANPHASVTASAAKAQWIAPAPFRWNYSHFAKSGGKAPIADQTLDMLFAKENAAVNGFNRWTINGVAYPDSNEMMPAAYHVEEGKRYRIHLRNASDDIHPIHLHRHTFELVSYAGQPMAGLMKDVIMLGGYQEAEIDFVANNPGLTLFHCHQQLHMDFGFMTLFDYK